MTTRPTAMDPRALRVVVRFDAARVMPPVKAAWCCQHVCGFRYADDMLPAGSIGSMRVLVVEGKHSAHRAAPPSCRRSTPQPRPGASALGAAPLAACVGRGGRGEARAR